jgi:hypothetical protein
MNAQTKKREAAEEKEARRRREIEELMQSMARTAPKADAELLSSVRGADLSQSSSLGMWPQEKVPEFVAPINPESRDEQSPAEPAIHSLEESTSMPLQVGAKRETIPVVSLSHAGTQGAEKQSAGEHSGEEGHVLRKPKISTVEAAIAEIGRAAREFPYRDIPGRGSVRVSEDVFSRVTMIFAKQRIDKILVLSYLLYSYIPAENAQRVAAWMLEKPPKVPRPRILIFIKDESLAKRLSDTAIRFGVTETDIIENIVRKHLPEAPFQYKPKRRMRFSA